MAEADLIAPEGVPAEDLDPLAEGVLMAHQRAWVEDQSALKIAEKGRRTGFTFAEALDSTLIAMQKRSEGGDTTWYIGDTKEKGLEFVATCATFAKTVGRELLKIDEFAFADQDPDTGESRDIAAYRIVFASGNRICGLSSRPAGIRGLQGRVIIDEAAFHANVRAVIDACNALLIWGGVIRIISTHNGADNPFNELIKETRAGKYDYRIHHATFDDAVANGLYERVCLMRGWEATAEGKRQWYDRVRRSYGSRTEAMREELDAVPREGEGTLLPLAWIEACSTRDYVVARWTPPAENFVDWAEHLRREEIRAWLAREVDPILETLPVTQTFVGEDFAMRQDRTCIPIGYVDETLRRHVPLIVELARCPYDIQRYVLFHIGDKLPRFAKGILDANGNGMALAQEARQKFGERRIVELMPSDPWQREHMPHFVTAFEDRMILIPADRDVRDDLRQLRMINGVGKMPRDVRTEGTDGGRRHGDAAIGLFNFYTASRQDVVEIDFRSVAAGPGAPQAAREAGALMPGAGAQRITDTGFGTVAADYSTEGF